MTLNQQHPVVTLSLAMSLPESQGHCRNEAVAVGPSTMKRET